MNHQDDNFEETVRRLRERLEADHQSGSTIAKQAGVSQPTVSRLRTKGQRIRPSKSFNKLCSYYQIDFKGRHADVADYGELLRAAVIDAWDGTPAKAQALLALIGDLKDLTKTANEEHGGMRGK